MDLPKIQQRSVEELIERNLILHGRGMDEIWTRFRNTVIVKALLLSDGNITAAAKLLKVHRNTLDRWIDDNGLRQVHEMCHKCKGPRSNPRHTIDNMHCNCHCHEEAKTI